MFPDFCPWNKKTIFFQCAKQKHNKLYESDKKYMWHLQITTWFCHSVKMTRIMLHYHNALLWYKLCPYCRCVWCHSQYNKRVKFASLESLCPSPIADNYCLGDSMTVYKIRRAIMLNKFMNRFKGKNTYLNESTWNNWTHESFEFSFQNQKLSLNWDEMRKKKGNKILS